MIARRTHEAAPARRTPADETPALALENITKRYGAVDALASVSLRVRRGTVHALLGENGAGKSTLMRIAYGLVRADSGTIAVHGAPAHIARARDAIAHGIGMVHQHFTLVPVMSVAENVALGGRGMLGAARVAERIRELAVRTGFALDPAATVSSLPIGAQQRVEIAKALIRDARILILDEPTAVLAPAETTELLRWLRAFADAGNAVVLITHKLREALSVADDVTVLRRGRTALTGRVDGVTRESLTLAMLGEGATVDQARDVREEATKVGARAASAERAVVYRAQGLTVVDGAGVVRIRDTSFTIHAGEIVGIAGIEGSGQRELLRVLAGRMDASSGVLVRPSRAGFIPEDRYHDAILLERDLAENVSLRGAGARTGTIDWRAQRAVTDRLMRVFDVRAADARAPMRTLSGGNQQKLVLARELQSDAAAGSHAIIAESPTRGLDVRATAAIHARLREAGAGGAAIILYSSDIDEVLLLATRVLVVHAGSVRDAPLDRDAIGRAMLGLA
ncbi:MAG: ATP-binding cassette domain-containing protein [Gemmatimonadaceae bacterium]